MTGLNIVVKKVDKCVCIYIYILMGKFFFFLKNIIVLKKKKKNYAIKISILSIN